LRTSASLPPAKGVTLAGCTSQLQCEQALAGVATRAGSLQKPRFFAGGNEADVRKKRRRRPFSN
jgi:hypothetical protein